MSHETARDVATSAGQTDLPHYDLTLLEAAFGPIVPREFDAAQAYAKPELWEWLINVKNISDEELYHASRSAIYESALVQRFRTNFEHVHCKATACYAEAENRLRQENHQEDCRPSGIYGRAHADVMSDHGYAPSSPVRPCTCGAATLDQHGETPAREG